MKIRNWCFLAAMLMGVADHSLAGDANDSGASIRYVGAKPVTAEQEILQKVIETTVIEVRQLLPDMPEKITFVVELVDMDLDIIGGITGRADAHKPEGEIALYISTSFPGGLTSSSKVALPHVLFHELHHLTTGWTMRENQHAPTILNAAVNEGLAEVFSEVQTGHTFDVNQPPSNAANWLAEIKQLPMGANYNHWVSGIHPDGREYIGYKTGVYLVREAMQNSGLNIIELSKLPTDKIVEFAEAKMD
ncbi:DUF2268 domain-containing putative Zn-dependent protease [Alteromonas facilis]|uniref:DUF2268 domain-containing putative Zn-dependent protease n=1 Tax=Alteromonas facilis TaxID=2048004 RepID=UPI000C289AB5|nr:DUF2268 domain-containing putative Zn-dependent protease [Alteromonas facilis]